MFWILISVIIYIYLGYPVFLKILSYGKEQNRYESKYYPTVTLIIAAHNEEKVIKQKIENSLGLDYSKDKLEIIVASDASTDRTNEIVKNYSDNGIELYEQEVHNGKSDLLNYVVKNMAKGEIIVFNDVTTFLERDSIRKIAYPLSEEKIGAVAGKIIFRSSNDTTITQNYGLYWRYEEFLRESESMAGYLPFVSGAFYAIRRNLYTHVSENLPDDSVSPLGVYRQGCRVVFTEDALAYERGAEDSSGEFRIKARGVVRELSSIFHFKELLNPLKYPMLSLVLISHRILRWSVPIFLIALFLINLKLLEIPYYRIFFWMQVSFYLFASIGFLLEFYQLPIISNQLLKVKQILGLPFYFCLVNIAAMWGIVQFILGKKKAVWEPVR